ncbi:MAG: alpha/beta fold hydrolase [Akkermansiaceae bacterium]|nr:alpha/beta fold hydrolase [Akkermansiaceae bacterium]MBJ7284001.1 alpha/beta fold hydrolase [Akkermansiaceae bacterium]MBJ7425091.1 alpha/beta fold hydrolase [Akkermansiaceae bacterium]
MKIIHYFTLFFGVFAFCSCSQIAELREINPIYQTSQSFTVKFPSAAEAFSRATKLEQKQPLVAGEIYLSTLRDLSIQLDLTPKDTEIRSAYNFALGRIFSLIRAHDYNPWTAPLQVGRFTFTYDKIPRAGWNPVLYEFLPTDQIEVGGEYLTDRVTRDGIGTSLVAITRDVRINAHKTFSLDKTYYGVSATAVFRGDICKISFHEPLDVSTVRVGKHSYPLTADFTTPLAVLLTRERPERLGLARLLDPDKYAETARLSRLRPYNKNLIPLLLVHGLLDTPATWMPMVNALRQDPVIRAKYQIWVYSYPSGYPYPYSAALLRKELDEVRVVFPDHKPIVFIGHSMGGMIGRLMLTDSGDKIWKTYFGKTPDLIDIPPQEKKLMQDMLIFQSRSDISRAIFICSPHRGAELASNWVGMLARKLVRVPQTILDLGDALGHMAILSNSGVAYESLPTSIDTLSPTNTFVKSVNELPINPRIPYHSIIGDRGLADAKANPKVGNDGFVAYTSSNLEGSKSQLIIPSNHSGHRHPAGVAEVIRTLHTHLETAR